MSVAVISSSSSVSPKTRGRGVKRALPRVLCIVGATASGKTALGIRLAKRFGGEVINADARQVYQDFNIGTGKFDLGTGKPDGNRLTLGRHRAFLIEGIPHHLYDAFLPEHLISVTAWRSRALRAIRDITRRGKLPILVGGTGMYVQALVDNYQIPAVPPQLEFRRAMEGKTLGELVALLDRIDSETVRVIDVKNRRRVLRALEVATFTGKSFTQQRSKGRPLVEPLLISIMHNRPALYERIHRTIDVMIKHGWLEEVRGLLARGVSLNAPAMSSIGYRELAEVVRGRQTLDAAVEMIKRATRNYAKRQLTWFRRDERIQWVKNSVAAIRLVEKWLARNA